MNLACTTSPPRLVTIYEPKCYAFLLLEISPTLHSFSVVLLFTNAQISKNHDPCRKLLIIVEALLILSPT